MKYESSASQALERGPLAERSTFRVVARWLARDKVSLLSLIVLTIVISMALFPGTIALHEPDRQQLVLRREPPSLTHPFGMDELGRDIFSRVVYGARYTLGSGIVAVTIGVLIGVPIGLLAGFTGGVIDSLLMRLVDGLLSFPYFLIAVMLAAAMGPGLASAVSAVGLVLIPSFARVTRGSVLSMKHNEYVLSAEAIGCSVPRILTRHVLPNVTAPLTVLATLNMATAILAVAGLGFLGLGLQPPRAEWGLMLSTAKGAMTNAPHVMLFPGIAIVLVVAACNLLGDGLRELLDPRMRNIR